MQLGVSQVLQQLVGTREFLQQFKAAGWGVRKLRAAEKVFHHLGSTEDWGALKQLRKYILQQNLGAAGWGVRNLRVQLRKFSIILNHLRQLRAAGWGVRTSEQLRQYSSSWIIW
jgi:hypothetical protein